MNKIIFLTVVSFFLTVSSFSQIKWMSWEEAVKANEKVPKKIFVDVYTDWCGWCKHMDNTTFQDPAIIDAMNKYYYAVKLDAERKDTVRFQKHVFINPNPEQKRSTHQLAQSLLDSQMSYPSFVILTGTYERVQVLPGFKTAQQFEPVLKFIGSDEYTKKDYQTYMSTFKGEAK
jgi:thioredoxin-related protein